MTITVNAINDAPVAVDDAYTTDEDTPLTVAAPGVLGNDTDVDGDPLTAVQVTAPASGTLVPASGRLLRLHAGPGLQRDRLLHLPGQRRSAGLERRHRDDHGQRGQRRAGGRLTTAYTTDEDTALTVAAPGVLGNDTRRGRRSADRGPGDRPRERHALPAADGSFGYTPDPDFNGTDTLHLQRQRRPPGLERRHGDASRSTRSTTRRWPSMTPTRPTRTRC